MSSPHLKRRAIGVDLGEVDQVAVVDRHILNLLSIHTLFQLNVSGKEGSV